MLWSLAVFLSRGGGGIWSTIKPGEEGSVSSPTPGWRMYRTCVLTSRLRTIEFLLLCQKVGSFLLYPYNPLECQHLLRNMLQVDITKVCLKFDKLTTRLTTSEVYNRSNDDAPLGYNWLCSLCAALIGECLSKRPVYISLVTWPSRFVT